MSKIIEQEEVVLGEGEEFGELSELQVAPEETPAEEVEAKQEATAAWEPPAKFKDKSIQDVVNSYTELEKAFGTKNNEVGELRKLTDQILQQSLKPDDGSGSPANSTIDVDSLLESPDTVINKAIDSNPRLKQLEDQLAASQRNEDLRGFETSHPGGMEKVGTPEFLNWIQESPTRTKLFREAHVNYDYGLAGELIDMFDGITGVQTAATQEAQTQQKAKRDQQLKDAVTETGSTGESPKKVYKKTDLMKMMIHNRDAYDDPVFQAELQKAYNDGRVR